MNLNKNILKYALQNAINYSGKASTGAVLGKVLAESPELKERIDEISKEINEAVKFVNNLSLDEQKYQLKNIAPELMEKKKIIERELPELPNAEIGKVVMRMAPYPSGPLHMGNARTFILNDEYVKKYNGKLLLVMDDTIGSEGKNISEDAYVLIPESLEWLGIKFDKNIIFKSGRLEIYYKYAEELIKKRRAYACFCSAEELRENRAKGVECKCREKSAKENMDDWKKMLKGGYNEGEAILRLKTDMKHRNPAFRDRVLFRISNRAHPRTSAKYRVWPMLEFSWAIDDHLLGITHILRGKDLMIESEMEDFIWDIFKWKKSEFLYTGLMGIKGVKISKSKSKKEVLSGVYSGWDDPRTWSLQSLKRRGIMPEAIRSFCLEAGMSQTEVTVPLENLYSENRKLLDSRCKRYFFVEDPIKIKIGNAPERKVKLKFHPDIDMGARAIETGTEFLIAKKDYEQIRNGDLIRMMDCLNFVKKGKKFIFDSAEVEKYREKGKRIIHWLPADSNIEAEILMPDASLKKGLIEKSAENLGEGEIVQLVRTGFCRLDKKNSRIVFWLAHN